jgi:uncharacterized protein
VKRLPVVLAFCLGFRLWAAEIIPPPPAKHFNDYAHVVSPDTAAHLNQTLEDFERESSEQILVAVFPKMQSYSSVEDYTVRVARTWKVGQKDKNNGAVLFVFVQDHKMFLQVGYGLEGVLPDAICKRIIAEQITPRFKSGDYSGGLTAGVQSIIAASKGEYRGNGTTVGERQGQQNVTGIPILLIIIVAVLLLLVLARVGRSGRRRGRGWIIGSGGGGWSGGSGGGWSSGGGGWSGGGGGSGFSGGGGSFGGGGAGGSW